jgi:hypothetical protein
LPLRLLQKMVVFLVQGYLEGYRYWVLKCTKFDISAFSIRGLHSCISHRTRCERTAQALEVEVWEFRPRGSSSDSGVRIICPSVSDGHGCQVKIHSIVHVDLLSFISRRKKLTVHAVTMATFFCAPSGMMSVIQRRSHVTRGSYCSPFFPKGASTLREQCQNLELSLLKGDFRCFELTAAKATILDGSDSRLNVFTQRSIECSRTSGYCPAVEFFRSP